MTSFVPSIVEVLMNKIALWISNRKNDWTAKSAMIASNNVLLVKSFPVQFSDAMSMEMWDQIWSVKSKITSNCKRIHSMNRG